LKLPDLVPDSPDDARNVLRGSYRDLQFTTAIGNIGDGPMILEGKTVSTNDGVVTQGFQIIQRRDGSECARSAGFFVFHDAHAHWHFDRFVSYELRVDDPNTGPLVAGGEKASFCLLDIEPIRGFNPTRFPRQITTQTCNSAEGIVGISVGWKDIYERILPGQSINLDADRANPVPVGSYILVNDVNPDRTIWENNYDNNRVFADVGISLSPRLLSGAPLPTFSPTPQRRPNERPRLRPGRIRPTRAPRPARPGATTPPTVAPTPTRTLGAPPPTATFTSRVNRNPSRRPTATPRPRQARPTRAPRPGEAIPLTPTPQPPVGVGCDNACPYDVSQLRFTWYDGLGLDFSGFVNPNAVRCPPLPLEPGTAGSMQLVNWLNHPGDNLGMDHTPSFVLGEGGAGSTSDGGEISISEASSGGFKFAYESPLPPPARAADGFQGFPVVFDVCFTVGPQAVKTRLVCQPKSRGMLCHEG
jgi:hypothetical protein